jgi:hypothetical protein
MGQLEINGNWSKIKERLIERYALLTEEDFQFGKEEGEKQLNHLQEKLGLTKDELKEVIRELK